MPIIDPDMTAEQMRHVAMALLQLGFFSGVAGAMCWNVLTWVFCKLADAIQAWEDKRIRIIKARANARALNAWNQSIKNDA